MFTSENMFLAIIACFSVATTIGENGLVYSAHALRLNRTAAKTAFRTVFNAGRAVVRSPQNQARLEKATKIAKKESKQFVERAEKAIEEKVKDEIKEKVQEKVQEEAVKVVDDTQKFGPQIAVVKCGARVRGDFDEFKAVVSNNELQKIFDNGCFSSEPTFEGKHRDEIEKKIAKCELPSQEAAEEFVKEKGLKFINDMEKVGAQKAVTVLFHDLKASAEKVQRQNDFESFNKGCFSKEKPTFRNRRDQMQEKIAKRELPSLEEFEEFAKEEGKKFVNDMEKGGAKEAVSVFIDDVKAAAKKLGFHKALENFKTAGCYPSEKPTDQMVVNKCDQIEEESASKGDLPSSHFDFSQKDSSFWKSTPFPKVINSSHNNSVAKVNANFAQNMMSDMIRSLESDMADDDYLNSKTAIEVPVSLDIPTIIDATLNGNVGGFVDKTLSQPTVDVTDDQEIADEICNEKMISHPDSSVDKLVSDEKMLRSPSPITVDMLPTSTIQ